MPFYSNAPDNTRCVQACLRMILKHLLNRDYSWEDLDEITLSKPGESTSPPTALMYMEKIGLETILIAEFDHQKFAEVGVGYLRDTYGDEVADWQIANGDMEKSRSVSRALLKSSVQYEHRTPTLEDIARYLKEGYTLFCGVNSNTLDGEDGYRGHSIIILSSGATTLEIHDPGLPSGPFRKVAKKIFIRAWAEHGPNIRAVRLPN